jgi:PhnB protein
LISTSVLVLKIRKELKKDNKARVTTYLNFPGNTEEAFNFYKKVFKGEFTGKGLQRFSDVDLPAGGPPMSEADKKLILHAELSILGGHILMATDARKAWVLKCNMEIICISTWNRNQEKKPKDYLMNYLPVAR